MATIVELMGGNDTFISRVYVHLNRLMTPAKKAHFCVYIRDHYFDAGYFDAGNEPGFEMPWAYHYANRPDLSALRVRKVVFENFNTGINGVSSPSPLLPLRRTTGRGLRSRPLSGVNFVIVGVLDLSP